MPKRHENNGAPVHELVGEHGEIVGDRNVVISGVAALDSPAPHSICFSNEVRTAKLQPLLDTAISAIIVKQTSAYKDLIIPSGKAVVVCSDPQRLLIRCIEKLFLPERLPPGVAKFVAIAESAQIGPDCAIGAFTSIAERVTIGANCQIHPNVTIYRDVRIGKSCVIHAGAVIREECQIGDGVTVQPGAVIGADGFGYLSDKQLGLIPVPQIGIVKLGNGVDVGANSCIDRATLGETKIGQRTKIDNLVQVGHNVEIGQFSLLCGQVGVAGSTKIGNQVVLGGGVKVADHLEIVDGVRVGGSGIVMSDVLDKGDYAGTPLAPAAAWRRQNQAIKKLPGLIRQLRKGKDD